LFLTLKKKAGLGAFGLRAKPNKEENEKRNAICTNYNCYHKLNMDIQVQKAIR